MLKNTEQDLLNHDIVEAQEQKNWDKMGKLLESAIREDGTLAIPEGVTHLPEAILKDNWDIKKLVLPSTMLKIGNAGFLGCKNLESVEFNTGLEFIGQRSFENTGLVSADIPLTVKNIASSAFSLTNMREVFLHEGLESIGAKAFEETMLVSVDVPSTVKSIGTSAFAKCAYLKEITLREGLEVLDHKALEYCTALENICIPSTVRGIEDALFYGCENLKNVNLGRGISYISGHAFYGTGIRTIVIPKTVKMISTDAFKGCKNLREVTLKNPKTHLYPEAFEDGTAIVQTLASAPEM